MGRMPVVLMGGTPMLRNCTKPSQFGWPALGNMGRMPVVLMGGTPMLRNCAEQTQSTGGWDTLLLRYGIVPGSSRQGFRAKQTQFGVERKRGQVLYGKRVTGNWAGQGARKNKANFPAAEKAVGQAPPYVPLRQGRRASGPLSSSRMPNGPIAAPGRWPCGLRAGRTERAGVPTEIADCRLRRVREMPR